MDRLIGWLAPILSTIIITAATASINAHIKRRDKVADERHAETEAKRKAEAEWRECVVKRLDKHDELMDTILTAQCSQMRSDILHKAHRYIDDLGCASTEEKQALWAEYEDYTAICDANNITNHFIDKLANQVMTLPNRDENR